MTDENLPNRWGNVILSLEFSQRESWSQRRMRSTYILLLLFKKEEKGKRGGDPKERPRA